MTSPAPIFPRFSDAEYRRRHELVRAKMAERGLDAVVAAGDSTFRNSNHANVYWLTSWLDPYCCYAVVPRAGEPFLIISNELYIHTARRASVVRDVEGSFMPGKLIGARLNDLGLSKGKIGLAGVRNVGRASMPYEHQKDLAATMPQATFEDAMEVMQAARLIKSAEEIAWFEKGAAFTDRAVAAIAENLHAGMPEDALSYHIHNAVLKDGSSLMFHFLGCTPMDAPEFIFPWQYPSTRLVRRGDILMTEISAGWWGYCGQIQRPFAVATPPTAEYQRLYDLAAECYARVFDVIRPGATDGDIRAAAAFIETSGCRTRDVLLHGWGVTIEPPRADLPGAMIKRELTPFTVAPGMLFVIQPHVVSPDGKRAVQVGNLVVCEASGARSLQQAPIEFVKTAS